MIDTVWDIPSLLATGGELTGYATQKPLVLYERIIKSTGNEGDIVLNPFAGCTTTCVAAERFDRQWVGIDNWDKNEDTLLTRMKKEGMIADGSMQAGDQMLLFPMDIVFTKELPERTDDNQPAVPFLYAKEKVKSPMVRIGHVRRCTSIC